MRDPFIRELVVRVLHTRVLKMGPTISKPEKQNIAGKKTKITYEIDQKIRKDHEHDARLVKLLLLGTGESGKTTLLKQMKLLYGVGVDKSALVNKSTVVKAVRNHVVKNLQVLFKACDKFYPIQSKSVNEQRFEDFLRIDLDGDTTPSPVMISLAEELWEDDGVQQTLDEFRHLIQIQDALPHFMNKFRLIFSTEYTPTEEDWLRVRVRTTGVIEEVFTLDGVEFKVVDVGGQKSERKKWLHCFSEVAAIIYVIALSEYDQYLFEDNNKNRMIDSLEMFQTTINNETLADVHWILFFNKSDLYREKLNKSPIKHEDKKQSIHNRFLDFAGPYCKFNEDPQSKNFEEALVAGISYFEQCFKSKANDPLKIATMHVTCAMDQHNVHVVFNAVRRIIINKILGSQGFIKSA